MRLETSAQIHAEEINQLESDQQQFLFYCKNLSKNFVKIVN